MPSHVVMPDRKDLSPPMPKRLDVLGVRVDRVNMAAAVRQVHTWVAERTPRQIVTVNPEFVMQARRNPHFRRVINSADLVAPDGIGIVLAARLYDEPITERVGGIDLVEQLAAQAAAQGQRIFLLGARKGVADAAARQLRLRHPTLAIAGTHAGSPHPSDEEAIRALIQAATPDILLVAYGAPAQDLWIARNLDHLNVPVALGVGGAFDFLAGRVPRAPLWMQRLGLEWLYRLARQPWRWRRMLALPRFGSMVLIIAAARRIRRLARK